jgi:hypothetical protein
MIPLLQKQADEVERLAILNKDPRRFSTRKSCASKLNG